jgi:predicted nucleic acid-binding protein
VLSEVRHPSGSKLVKDAIGQLDDERLFLSALTIGEITKGIALLPAGKTRSGLESWLNKLQLDFGDRILPIETDIARVWGTLTARLQKTGMPLPAVDGLIAATALHHGMHLLTRNTRHFEATGVLILDPWQQ